MAPSASMPPLFKYEEGGKRPRSVRVYEVWRPLHQACYHGNPRTASSSSQPSARSNSAPSLRSMTAEKSIVPKDNMFGGVLHSDSSAVTEAAKSLWQLQGLEFRKPPETPACVAPALLYVDPLPLRRGGTGCTSRGVATASQREANSQDQRVDDVLHTLVRDSPSWGIVQERQARLMDENRALTRKSNVVHRETSREVRAGSDELADTFSSSQLSWQPKHPQWCGMQRSVPPIYESAYGKQFCAQNLYRKAKRIAKNIQD